MTRQADKLKVRAGLCAAVLFLFLALPQVAWFLGQFDNAPCRFAADLLEKPHQILTDTEHWTQDLRMRFGRKAPISTNLLFLGIDASNYRDVIQPEDLTASPILEQLKENFPWSREVWAVLVERLAQAGARVIALDLLFAAEGKGDERLREVIEKYRDKVVLAVNLTSVTTDERGAGGRGNVDTLVLPAPTVLPPQPGRPAYMDDRLGLINIFMDTDGVFRSATYRYHHETMPYLRPGEELLSMPARILQKMGRQDSIPPGYRDYRIRWAAEPGEGFPIRSVLEVFDQKLWTRNYINTGIISNKVVLVGPAANFFQDLHRTPFEQDMLGPEIHLNILNAALQGEFLSEPPPWLSALSIVAAGALALLIIMRITKPAWRATAMLGAVVAYAASCQVLFNEAGVLLSFVQPSLAFLASSFPLLIYDFVLEQREKTRIRGTLERYVSRDVVRELLDNPQSFLNTLGGVRKPVTILFSDIRNFTSQSENTKPEDLVTHLNEYFDEMVPIVFRQHGRLDKFIGDAVMADWGSITTAGPREDACRAVRAALAMQERLAYLNKRWQQQGRQTFAIGIGINHGEVIIGNLGSHEKMEVSVIGDAVNLASRLEGGVTKEYHVPIALGESVAKLVHDHFILRTVDLIQVKGKSRPIEVFTVLAERNTGVIEPPWLADYEQAVKLYRQRRFKEAEQLLAKCLAQVPDDFLCQHYLERCRELILNPPDDSWDGVFIMKSK